MLRRAALGFGLAAAATHFAYGAIGSGAEAQLGRFGLAFERVRDSYVDITETLDAKVRAMACYESELREYPHPRSERALRERAAFWGSRIGRVAAEPFCVLREIR